MNRNAAQGAGQIIGQIEGHQVVGLDRCRIPDDYICKNRYPLFMARAVLQQLIESLQSTGSVKPC